MVLFKEIKDKAKIKQIKEHPYYAEELKRINELYEEIKDRPMEVLTKKDFFIFHETGSRLEYERKYHDRRTRLDIFFIMYLLYERDEDLKRLEDVVWAICNEFTWSLPAHIRWENPLEDMIFVDLFAAETGQTMGEILYTLEDRLSDYIKVIMRYEVNRRVIESYKNNTYWWETMDNNWSAVCAGSVGMTFIYCAPEQYKDVEDRLMKSFDAFLSSYGDDGICTEGLGYWNYGFGYYLYFSQLLYEFTDGKKNMMDNDKIREMVQFQQRLYLSGDTVASFSDGGRNGNFEPGLTHRLKAIYPNLVKVPDKSYENKDFTGRPENRFAMCLRNLFWTNPEYAENTGKYTGENYYESAQWYINIKDKFGFAAKGGHNDEAHNHNDIGNFIIAADSTQLLADIGAGEYTKDYFNGEKRYQILCCSSEGHSVPEIDGKSQLPGKEHAGRVFQGSDNKFVLDIAGAYEVEGLKSIVRSFEVSENSVKLNDKFEFSDNNAHTITERFISLIEPKVQNNTVKIGSLTISANDTLKIVEDTDNDHDGNAFPVWKIEYTVSDNEFNIEFNID